MSSSSPMLPLSPPRVIRAPGPSPIPMMSPLKPPMFTAPAPMMAAPVAVLVPVQADKKLWAYLIIGFIVICVCLYIFRISSKTTLPSGTPAYIANSAFMYTVTTGSVLAAAYSAYRCSLACGSDEGSRNLVNLAFGLQMVLVVIWFYYFYRQASYNVAFCTGIALTLTTVVNCWWAHKTGDKNGCYALLPLLLLEIAGVWASHKAKKGAAL